MKLDDWRDQGVISAEQYGLLNGLARNQPFSVFLELNILLYAGVAAFVGGLAWTVQSYSSQLGDVVVLAVLTGILAACLWYCFSRAMPWSAAQVSSPSLVFDYVLYLGSLTWTVELGYLEARLHVMSGQWDNYLLATAIFFFLPAYRFDNRFGLSLALSSLAGWFGLRLSHWPSTNDAAYRYSGVVYGLLVGAAGIALRRTGIKAHFLGTYLNLAANVFLIAVLSGAFTHDEYGWWFLLLVAGCAASLAYGIDKKQFSFVAYAAVYGYVGVSSVLVRHVSGDQAILSYFVITGMGMLVLLFTVARRFGREA
jgi:hypothetical protein